MDKSLAMKIAEIDNPVYVFDNIKFISNYLKLSDAFKRYYPNFNIGYSYKTNYTPAICKMVNMLGGYAEVVSPFEVEHAKKCGISYNRIIYNGVCKDEDSSHSVLYHGGKYNCDNLNDVMIAYYYANRQAKEIGIGLRLNFDIGNNLVSRFGFDICGEDIIKAMELIRKSKNLKVEGIHCHFSKGRDLNCWKNRIFKMISFSENFRDLKYIDLGSNLYSEMEPSLAEQYGDNLPTFDDYAKVVGQAMIEAFPDAGPELIIEAGTPIVANAFYVLAKVVDIKKVRGKQFVTMNCSKFNLGCICDVKNVPIEVFHVGKEEHLVDGPSTLVGYTCIEDDVLNVYDGKIGVGDLVLFKNVGAYSLNFSPTFINPKLGIVQIDGNGPKVIKKRESYSQAFDSFKKEG